MEQECALIDDDPKKKTVTLGYMLKPYSLGNRTTYLKEEKTMMLSTCVGV
jgi:hypothetical protein